MANLTWRDPNVKHQTIIESWRRILQDLDKRCSAPENSSVHLCHQLLPFPKRPQPCDLVPSTGTHSGAYQELAAEITSAEDVRKMIRKRRKLKASTGNHLSDSKSNPMDQDSASDLSSVTKSEARRGSAEDSQLYEKQLHDLLEAVRSLKEKLEILQPEGKRPSDIEKANRIGLDASPQPSREVANDDEVLLSQQVTSQRSILMWDDIQVLVHLAFSGEKEISTKAKTKISSLGLEDLEDNALHRLCVNEIFPDDSLASGHDSLEDNVASTEATSVIPGQLSYGLSLYLYQVLFLRKTLQLKSTPTRLFFDAMMSSGKAHGRAMVDGVLLPVVRDYERYSRYVSELVQKVMKEQSSATMIHFLSQMFDCTLEKQDPSKMANTPTGLSRLSIIFVTEIHLGVLQMILGFKNVPCPVPTRMWTKLNEILERLWDLVSATIVGACTSAKGELRLKGLQASILKIYCTPNLWDAVGGADVGNEKGMAARQVALTDQDSILLSNAKLIQFLMMWVVRQGPVCQDLANLQRMRQFCDLRLDRRLAKGLVTKLDAFIKRQTK